MKEAKEKIKNKINLDPNKAFATLDSPNNAYTDTFKRIMSSKSKNAEYIIKGIIKYLYDREWRVQEQEQRNVKYLQKELK